MGGQEGCSALTAHRMTPAQRMIQAQCQWFQTEGPCPRGRLKVAQGLPARPPHCTHPRKHSEPLGHKGTCLGPLLGVGPRDMGMNAIGIGLGLGLTAREGTGKRSLGMVIRPTPRGVGR